MALYRLCQNYYADMMLNPKALLFTSYLVVDSVTKVYRMNLLSANMFHEICLGSIQSGQLRITVCQNHLHKGGRTDLQPFV